ncbi:MAG: glycoside hydrolase [Candidatus Hydrogenedentes bacterium]|nr:glycoside hydrolase [Candidatus Hydrogenedentota bacterium]
MRTHGMGVVVNALLGAALLGAALLGARAARGQDEPARHNICQFGAQADGASLCTHAIQQAIDRCAQEGGCVYFPPGKFLSGPVRLRSGVTILLDDEATWLGSRSRDDYNLPPASEGAAPKKPRAFIEGYDLEGIAIRGGGTIDINGDAFKQKDKYRPKGLYFENCRRIRIEGIHLRNAGSWMQHYRFCEDVDIRDIAVFNHASYNNDGLDVDSCRRVQILGCVIDSDDDAIVLKSLSQRPCEDVTVLGCVVRSHCNAIKLGTESGGGFVRISVSACEVSSPAKTKAIYGRDRGLAGIALEIVDGGRLEDVTVEDIAIRGVSVPIFLRLGNRARPYVKDQPKPDVGTFRRVRLSRIAAEGVSNTGCSITGLPGHPIEDVRLEDIRLEFDGGGTADHAQREVPERPEAYPESTMFGVLPAYGFYCRHVKGIAFRNVTLLVRERDERPAIVCDDVSDLAIDALDVGTGGVAPVRFINVAGAELQGCIVSDQVPALLRVEGEGSKNITIAGEKPQDVETLFDRAAGAPEDAVSTR